MSDEEKVAYVLELDVPGTPKGQEVEIPGLGVFKNGQSYDITEDEAENYRNANVVAETKTVKVKDGDQKRDVVVSEISQGPTLLQAFQGQEDILVSTPAAPKPQEKKKEGDS